VSATLAVTRRLVKFEYLRPTTLRMLERRSMDLGLDGRVVLVSGGARGIGAATALTFAQEGADVAVLDLEADASAQATVDSCTALGVRAIVVAADVADRSSIDVAVQQVAKQLGRIDILVHSAGITRKAGPLDDDDAGWRRVLDVHLGGSRNLCRAVTPGMIERRYGRIILLGSMAGHIEGGDYAVAMAAKLQYMRDLSRTLGKYGITANAVSPGKIMTGLQDPFYPTDLDRRRYAQDHIPLRRAGHDFPVATDVAGPIVLLCSEPMGHITGVELHVNGGEYLHD
jgi:3-oxoacyl-[acyl-carrier protein] reductase